jgi:hypothetical protein
MAEVIHVFEGPVLINGKPYTVQVCGRPNGHMWDGWIEFIPADGGDVRRSARETTQPDRAALEYWSGGLSGTYLEGSFARTIQPPPAKVPAVLARPHFDAPAPPRIGFDGAVHPHLAEGLPRVAGHAVLDPFSVGAKGEDLLRRELGALRHWHLRNIAHAYGLADESMDLEALSEPELVDLIVAAVQPMRVRRGPAEMGA